MDPEDLLICKACGTQFDVPASTPLKACRICDDPRQYIPPTGQAWTSLRQLKKEGHKNVWVPDAEDKRVTSFYTEPKVIYSDPAIGKGLAAYRKQVGIGQRAILFETPEGNVLWDCIAYLDGPTIEKIKSKGGLKAIVISHPHFYTTHIEWGRTFNCPVYISVDDQEWHNRDDSTSKVRKFITGRSETIIPGVTAVKTGGHFDGSLVMLWDKKMGISDSLMTVPSGLYHIDRLPGTTSYSFMWSIPNMIPLPPDTIHNIWKAVKDLDFNVTYGNFIGMDIRGPDLRKRVLESMKIQVRSQGFEEHAIFSEVA